MLPLPDHVPLFLLLLFPAWIVGIAVHELGHLIVGSLVGLDVVACGLGMRKPFWSRTWRGITFYLGRPITAGLNLFVIEDLRWPRRQMMAMVLAGPLASILLAIVAWSLWRYNQAPTLFSALFWTAAFAAFGTLVPAQARRGPITLSTDGMTAWRLFCNRSRVAHMPPGILLATQADLAKTCQRIDCLRGEIYTTLTAALLQVSLKDGCGALETLEASCLRDPRRAGSGEALELYVRAALRLADSSDTSLALQALDRVAHRSPELQAAVALLHLDLALEQQKEVSDLLQVAEQAVAACARPELIAEWQALRLIALAPDDFEDQANRLLDDNSELPQLTALRLRIEVTRHLAERGLHEKAQSWFQVANAHMATIASTISLPATRERFLASFARRLRRIVELLPDDAPIFAPLPTVDPVRGEQARQWAMLMCSMAALATAIVLISLLLGEFRIMHGASWIAVFAGYVGLSASGRAIWLGPRLRPMMTMFFIANLALAISAAALLMRIDRRESASSERPQGTYRRPADFEQPPHADAKNDGAAPASSE